ncbi:PHP domain-containing protein [Candidatus Nitrospira inopinata]|jgi:predicted metal-dependent phosphoesterase TrpH|uniref:Phosphoesterase n=1 Tax=Candidatus Nitrospira inopinata TaxID=1715989 RepID=A0A0S4KRB1_9BACT|nr:PHP domain-containing protein [Candidatus Nitrospira inopinata]CUQ66972.1 Phosphoesterase [Candidatus Nitrospira inopinata]
MSRADLHLHTTHSDGSFTPAEVIALAHEAGVTAAAITDHDITSGIPEATRTGRERGIDVIPGVEISSLFGDAELHVLGYFLDWQDETLNRRLAVLRESRHRRNPKIIERLQAAGIDITYDEVRAVAGTDSVGRPHIARVLIDKRVVASAQEAFDLWLAEGRPAYVARELPAPAEAIRWIKDAKGLAVLAHPTWIKTPDGTLSDLARRLKADGLAGIEVYYSTHTARQTREYLALAKQLDLLVTGGSDFHGMTKPDIGVGVGRGTLHVPCSLVDSMKRAHSKL